MIRAIELSGEEQYPSSSWQRRAISLVIVLLVHAALLLIARSIKSKVAVEPSPLVHVVDLPIEQPQEEPVVIADPVLLASSPPPVPAPEFAIEEPQVATPTEVPLLIAANSRVSDAGNTRQSSGGGVGEGGDGTGSGEDAFTKCTNRVMPDYPSGAKNRGESGKVTLVVQLDERGRIASVEVVRSTGSRSLDEASIRAIRRWKCLPVVERGRPVRAITKQEFEFTLKK